MTAFLNHEKNKIASFLNHEKKDGYNAIDETVNLVEGKNDNKEKIAPAEKVLVIAPANLLAGFRFMVENEDGTSFLVTVPRDVEKGEQFEIERTPTEPGDVYDDDEEHTHTARRTTRNTAARPARDDVLGKIACCCQAAPCCFPDGCCPDGCCPDGCCPNGNCGEQFEGMCLSYDFRSTAKARPAARAGQDHEATPGSSGLPKILRALLDSGATPRLMVSGAQAALASATTQNRITSTSSTATWRIHRNNTRKSFNNKWRRSNPCIRRRRTVPSVPRWPISRFVSSLDSRRIP